jgi:hypothetical protein
MTQQKINFPKILTAAEARAACLAINKFGDNDHPAATTENLKFFAAEYVRDCCNKVAGSAHTREFKKLARNAAGQFHPALAASELLVV